MRRELISARNDLARVFIALHFVTTLYTSSVKEVKGILATKRIGFSLFDCYENYAIFSPALSV